MAEITKPIALNESFNTTEGSPRNLADVLAQGIGDLVTVVSRISHQTVYDELSDLEDVNISSPTNGDVLTYDGSKWVNGQGGGGASVEQMIAPVETSTTASQAYAIGEQFILNGTLYTATAAITAGGTITIGGNCTASDSVTEQIKSVGVKLIDTASANQTYANQLTYLATAYGNLTTNQKLSAFIKIGSNVFRNASTVGLFTRERINLSGTPDLLVQSFQINTTTASQCQIKSNSTTFTNISTTTSSDTMELYA